MTSVSAATSKPAILLEPIVFKRDVLNKLEEAELPLAPALVRLVASYVGNRGLFGAEMWSRCFGVDVVDDEPELTEGFCKFWQAQDPLDKSKRVYETHLPPILRPRVVVQYSTQTGSHYSLNLLGQLIRKPLEGHRSQFDDYETRALAQHGKTKAEDSCWLVMRTTDGVFARGFSTDQQVKFMKKLNADTHTCYEELPSVLDVATCVLAGHVVTGNRFLGDASGMEGRMTYSRCKDIVTDPYDTFLVTIGCHTSLGGLDVDDDDFGDDVAFNHIGVMGVRKFDGKEGAEGKVEKKS